MVCSKSIISAFTKAGAAFSKANSSFHSSWFAGPGIEHRRDPAPNEFIGAIKLWIEENYRSQFRITVGISSKGRRSFELFGNPGHGRIRIEFTCPDLSFPLSRRDKPITSVSLDIGCWEEYLEIEEFSAGYDDPEFFDKLQAILDWVLLGHKIRDLVYDPWSALCYAFCNTYLYVSEKANLSLRSLASSWGMMVRGIPKCRGPP